jgi:hypothetical protein
MTACFLPTNKLHTQPHCQKLRHTTFTFLSLVPCHNAATHTWVQPDCKVAAAAGPPASSLYLQPLCRAGACPLRGPTPTLNTDITKAHRLHTVTAAVTHNVWRIHLGTAQGHGPVVAAVGSPASGHPWQPLCLAVACPMRGPTPTLTTDITKVYRLRTVTAAVTHHVWHMYLGALSPGAWSCCCRCWLTCLRPSTAAAVPSWGLSPEGPHTSQDKPYTTSVLPATTAYCPAASYTGSHTTLNTDIPKVTAYTQSLRQSHTQMYLGTAQEPLLGPVVLLLPLLAHLPQSFNCSSCAQLWPLS